MARRRFSNLGQTRSIPKPIAVPVATLDIDALKYAYEWHPVDELAALSMGAEWYSNNLTKLLIKSPLTPEEQKTYDRALKARTLAERSTTPDGERVAAYTQTLRAYERIWADKKSLPKMDEAFKIADVSPRVANVNKVLHNYNEAFAATGIRFRMTLNEGRELRNGVLLIPKTELEARVTEPVLKTLFNEVQTIAQAMAVAVDADGNESADGEKFLASLPLVLNSVYDWAARQGGSITNPVGRAAKTKTPKAPKVPGTPGTGSTGITRTRRWAETDVIHVVIPGNPFKGQMNIKYALVKDGMTIREYKAARRAAGNLGAGVGPIEAGVDKGLLDVRP